MRRLVLSLGCFSCISAVLAIAACGSDTTYVSADSGGDASADVVRRDAFGDDDETDAKAPLPDASGNGLITGPAFLIGVTTDGDVIALGLTSDTKADLIAVPVAGGEITTIAKDTDFQNDFQTIRGNTVVFWSGVSAAGVGTLNYWTRAGGAQLTKASGSPAGLLGAKPDGSKLLYMANSVLANNQIASADVGYLDLSTNTATTALSGADAVNISAAIAPQNGTASCLPVIRFGGDSAFLAYCTGTLATEKKARITKILGGTATRIDTASANGVQPLMAVDADGATVLTIGLEDEGSKVHVIKPGTSDTVLEDGKVDTGFVVKAGANVVFHNDANKVLRYDSTAAPTAGTGINLVADAKAVKFLPRLSGDQKTLAVSYLDPVSMLGVNLLDLHLVTTEGAGGATPSDVVGTATAFAFQFTPDNSTITYIDELNQQTGGKLKAVPVTGGTPKTIQAGVYGARVPVVGTGALGLVNPSQGQDTGEQLFDLTWSKDPGAGVQGAALETLVQPDSVVFQGDKLVYQREGDLQNKGFGVFVITLPK